MSHSRSQAHTAPEVRVRTHPVPSLRQRAWWLMRQLPRFGVDDLLFTLAEGVEADATDNLQSYIRELERAGVLKRLSRSAPAGGPGARGRSRTLWRMVRDLGRAAPVARSATRSVFDPNSGRALMINGLVQGTLQAESEVHA